MSQAKVDKYKEEKANRKETMAKQKRNRIIAKICGSLVAIALVGWIGVSTVTYVIENRPVKTIYTTTAGVEEYLDKIFSDETEEESEGSTESTESTDETETAE